MQLIFWLKTLFIALFAISFFMAGEGCLLVKTASEIALKSSYVRRFFTKKLVESMNGLFTLIFVIIPYAVAAVIIWVIVRFFRKRK